MTNFEKYFKDLTVSDFGVSDGKVISCIELICDECAFRRAKSCSFARMSWLKREYKEPSKITISDNTPIDAKVLVSDTGEDWFKRHYAGCVDGKYYAWNEGRTSWSSNPSNKITWEYMKEYVESEKSEI